jgi:helix-turn-helix protein
MSDGEHKLVDASGDYRPVVRDGEPVPEASWRSCRIVLTDERLVLATNDGKRQIPLETVSPVDDADAVVPEDVTVGGATPIRVGETVLLVDASSVEDFESEYCRAVLHDAVILAKHRAIVGGVVRDDASWSKARFRFDGDRVVLGFSGGETATFDIADVGTIDTRRETVDDTERGIVAVEHTDSEGRSVETHFSGTERHVSALTDLLGRVIESRKGDHDLSETERQVLMALYSGVSPFEMAEFVGIDVEEVEEIYQGLLEAGAVDKVRERTEVTLNAQGRNLASEAMNER